MPDSSSPRDSEWIREIQAGSHAAFEDMFHCYHAQLCTFAWRYVKSEEVAKDLVQDVFLKIWRGRLDWHPRGTVRAYLYRSVRNQATNHHKHQQVRDRYAEEVVHILDGRSHRTPLENLSYRELEAHLQQSIRQLPPRRRLIFTLSRVDGLTYDEIADTLDISSNTVHTQIKRALASLRKRFSNYRSEAS